jgi:hypothetical protein
LSGEEKEKQTEQVRENNLSQVRDQKLGHHMIGDAILKENEEVREKQRRQMNRIETEKQRKTANLAKILGRFVDQEGRNNTITHFPWLVDKLQRKIVILVFVSFS